MKTADEILHDIFIVGLSAAALFVKNPKSQIFAQNIANILQSVVLPLVDAQVNKDSPAPPA